MQYGLDPAAVPAVVIERIAVGVAGAARVAIEVLYKAVREAGRRNESSLSVELVPDALTDAQDTIRQRSLSKLRRRQRRLLSVLSALDGWATMGDIEDAFVARYDPVSRVTIRKHPPGAYTRSTRWDRRSPSVGSVASSRPLRLYVPRDRDGLAHPDGDGRVAVVERERTVASPRAGRLAGAEAIQYIRVNRLV